MQVGGSRKRPAVTARLLASGETARPDTTRPGGCSGMSSGSSRARPAGTGLAGSMRIRKNRVAGGVVSGSRASFCAASTNVRLSAAAVTPVNVPYGGGAVILASSDPVAVTRATASVSGANGRPGRQHLPSPTSSKSDVKSWDYSAADSRPAAPDRSSAPFMMTSQRTWCRLGAIRGRPRGIQSDFFAEVARRASPQHHMCRRGKAMGHEPGRGTRRWSGPGGRGTELPVRHPSCQPARPRPRGHRSADRVRQRTRPVTRCEIWRGDASHQG